MAIMYAVENEYLPKGLTEMENKLSVLEIL